MYTVKAACIDIPGDPKICRYICIRIYVYIYIVMYTYMIFIYDKDVANLKSRPLNRISIYIIKYQIYATLDCDYIVNYVY